MFRFRNFNHLYQIFVVVCLVASCLWMHLDAIGWWWGLAILVLFYLLASERWTPARVGATRAPAEVFDFPDRGLSKKRLEVLTFAALVFGPALLLWLCTANEEFPVSGDYLHHLEATGHAVHFWKHLGPWVILVALLGFGIRRRFRSVSGLTRYLWVVVFALLLAWSFTGNINLLLARFPAFHYSLSAWFDLTLGRVLHLFGWERPLFWNRIVNLSAIPIWLLVLRPVFVGRWPDLAAAAAGIFFFWQADHAWLMGQMFLEPWAIVFSFLAVEVALGGSRKSKADTRAFWLAPMLAVTASLFKENAILILPIVVALSWKGPRSLAVSGLAILPFLVYYAARKSFHVFRSVEWFAPGELFRVVRVHAWLERLSYSWGVTALAVFFLGGVLGLVLFKGTRLKWAVLLAGAFGQFFFYFADKVSDPWTGYPRFQVFAWVSFASLFFLVPWDRIKKFAPLVLIALVLLHMPGLTVAIRDSVGSDAKRSFRFHTDEPIYFPFRKLVRKMEARLVASKRQAMSSIAINVPMGDGTLAMYPDIAKQYKLDFPYLTQGRTRWICRCSERNRAVFLPVVFSSHFEPVLHEVLPPPSDLENCLIELRVSCEMIEFENIKQSQDVLDRVPSLTGVLGVSPKRL